MLLKRLFFPQRRRGRVMTGWFLDWQTAVAWLVVTAMASVIYFGSMRGLSTSATSWACLPVGPQAARNDHSRGWYAPIT